MTRPLTDATTTVDVRREHRKRHVAEACEQHLLGILDRSTARGIDRLLDKAVRILRTVPDREQRRLTERAIDVSQRDPRQITAQRPSTAVSLLGADIARVA